MCGCRRHRIRNSTTQNLYAISPKYCPLVISYISLHIFISHSQFHRWSSYLLHEYFDFQIYSYSSQAVNVKNMGSTEPGKQGHRIHIHNFYLYWWAGKCSADTHNQELHSLLLVQFHHVQCFEFWPFERYRVPLFLSFLLHPLQVAKSLTFNPNIHIYQSSFWQERAESWEPVFWQY